jgi:cytochrome c
MKKFIIPIVMLGLLAACGGGSGKKEGDKKDTPAANDVSGNPDYQAGLALVGKSDCLTCHKIDEKVTGPAYRDVANKYASMPDTIIKHLAGKIISGGNGVWGEIMMTPHPAVSEADAEAMVKYILLLKK